MKINILGTEYEIIETTSRDDPRLEQADGWCGTHEKKIIIESSIFNHAQGGDMDFQREERRKYIKRHEIIHAFFNESGLPGFSANEQIVDWIATQFPKMLEVYRKVRAL